MSEIVKTISQQIESQFPALYKEEGAEMIAFLEAYYEFLEETPEYSLKLSRNMFENRDVDTTLEAFVNHFKEKYLSGLPLKSGTDTGFVVKHIMDLYRSKGSEQSIKLLFRLIFGENISVYYPASDILKVSDSKWEIPHYLEVSYSDNIKNIIGRQVTGSISGAKAFVESIVRKTVNGNFVYLVYLSEIRGSFVRGDILSLANTSIVGYPMVNGSLTSVEVTEGDGGYQIGDLVDITGAVGTGATGRVSSIQSSTNKSTFQLDDGGYGYSLSGVTNVYVSTSILYFDNSAQSFIIGETVTQGSNTGIVVGQNTSAIGLHSSTYTFDSGISTVSSESGITFTADTIEDRGTGATFGIGSLINTESITVNTDLVGNYLSTSLNGTFGFPAAPSANLATPIGTALTTNSLTIGEIEILSKINPGSNYFAKPFAAIINSEVAPANKLDIRLDLGNITGTFIVGELVTHTNGARGKVRSIDYDNKFVILKNMSYSINFQSTGTITGAYGTADVIGVNEVAGSAPMGLNAEITTDVKYLNGFITGLDIVNSGFGFYNGEVVTVSLNGKISMGTAYANSNGTGSGYWKSTSSHLNSNKKIRDNDYYQEYSYEIESGESVERYKDIVKQLVHIPGTKLFGKVIRKSANSVDISSKSAIVITTV